MSTPDLQSWYNNTSSYPDVTLILHSARDNPNPRQHEIRIHRAIVCQGNDFIEGLIGHNSSLGSHTRVVHFHDDVLSEVIETVVRHAYGFPLPEADSKQWQTWLSIATGRLVLHGHAELDTALKEHAKQSFKSSAYQHAHADKIGPNDALKEIVKGIRNVHDSALLELIVTLHIHRRATYKGNDREVAWALKQESEVDALGFCLPPGPGEPGYERFRANREKEREISWSPQKDFEIFVKIPFASSF